MSEEPSNHISGPNDENDLARRKLVTNYLAIAVSAVAIVVSVFSLINANTSNNLAAEANQNALVSNQLASNANQLALESNALAATAAAHAGYELDLEKNATLLTGMFFADSIELDSPEDQAALERLDINVRILKTPYWFDIESEGEGEYLYLLFENRGPGIIKTIQIDDVEIEHASGDITAEDIINPGDFQQQLNPNEAFAVLVDHRTAGGSGALGFLRGWNIKYLEVIGRYLTELDTWKEFQALVDLQTGRLYGPIIDIVRQNSEP